MAIAAAMILLGLPVFVLCNSCKIKLDDDSESVKNPRKPKNTTEPLVCGVREMLVFLDPDDRSEVLLDLDENVGIDWDEASCIDNNSIVYNIHWVPDEEIPEIILNKYFVFQCISSGPIGVLYSGQLPTVGNIFASYLTTTKRHVTILYVPFESSKSGNYTFELEISGDRWTKWFYVFFNSTEEQFSRPHSKKLKDETYEDYRDPSNIIIPCQDNDPGQRHVVLTNATLNNITYEYDPSRGIVIKRAELVKNLELISERHVLFGVSQNVVQCQLSEYSKITAHVLVNLETKPRTVELGGSNQLGLLAHGESKLGCFVFENSFEEKRLLMRSIYFITSSEWRFVSKCALKGESCDWNLQWTDKGDFITNRKALTNRKFVTCLADTPCYFDFPFRSGLVRCTTEDEFDSYTGLYFTGLDNQLYLHEDLNKLPPNVLITMKAVQSARNPSFRLYPREIFKITCQAVYFALLPGFSWTLVFQNGSESTIYSENNNDYLTLIKSPDLNIGEIEEEITLWIPENTAMLKCQALVRDTNDIYVSVTLNVHEKWPPVNLHHPKNSYMVSEKDPDIKLTCVMDGDPKPNLEWITSEGVTLTDAVVTTLSDGSIGSELAIFNFSNPLGKENFTCVGTNSEGSVYANFLVEMETNIKDTTRWGLGVVLIVTVGIFVLVIVVILASMLKVKRQKVVLSSEDMRHFLDGEKIIEGVDSYHCSQPYKKEIEVDTDDFIIDKGEILGTGFYGMVLKGQVRGVVVAVKTVKPDTPREYLLAILAEIKIMSSLDEHPNLVTFIGAHTINVTKGKVYLFVEFCGLGSVERFLKKTRMNMTESNTPADEEEKADLLKILVNWSLQTAQGMKYLSECKVIHGDLAIRNLLLKDMFTVKITDFGLARQLQNYSVYQKTEQQPLPWRHMSPESLSAMEFSVKSDVWAFGVTLWEMFSIGAIPYSGLQWTVDFASKLETGLRLEQPILCLPKLFAVMKRCWELNSTNRPDFVELMAELQQLYITNYDDDYMDLTVN